MNRNEQTRSERGNQSDAGATQFQIELPQHGWKQDSGTFRDYNSRADGPFCPINAKAKATATR